MKRITLNILSMLLFCSGLLAQEFTQVVRGRVIDVETQSPIPFATVYVNTIDPVIFLHTDKNHTNKSYQQIIPGYDFFLVADPDICYEHFIQKNYE